jgi:multidrug efflux pump subunit AcrA (membrane-fusion protein)
MHEGGRFEPRMIQIGVKLDGKVAVLSGLKPGEEIVTSGNFLIDSESRLKSAMGDMKH